MFVKFTKYLVGFTDPDPIKYCMSGIPQNDTAYTVL